MIPSAHITTGAPSAMAGTTLQRAERVIVNDADD